MSKAESPAIRAHEDGVLFREALQFTAAQSGFAARLVEKDYFCTVLLDYLAATAGSELTFKGGTCLAKVHSELYRLSEDLDYTMPVAFDTARSKRSQKVAPVKTALGRLNNEVPAFRVIDELKGANNSTQYLALVGYQSMLARQPETIKIEVSLREPLLMPAVTGRAQTLLVNPMTNSLMVAPISLSCMDITEALAEKFRAALSRREPAIRDYFDIDHAIRNHRMRPDSPEFIDQVRQKLAIPGNDPVNASGQRLEALRRQVEPQLRPVLRDKDFAEFDLDRAFAIGTTMAQALEKR